MNYQGIENALVAELKKFIGDKKAIIGISGGLDSAVVASLCARAIGKENVIGIMMPYGNQSIRDSEDLIKSIGINCHFINIKDGVDTALSKLPFKVISRLTNGNLRARERMSILYALAGELNGLVIGTGNKTEILLGYFTKWGDGGVDIEPLGNLYKTEVLKLARHLKDIPNDIINKPPSAELWEGQTDEGEIGMTYVEMDDILRVFEYTEKTDYAQNRYVLAKKHGNDKVFIIEKRVRESEHKRNPPKTIIVNKIIYS